METVDEVAGGFGFRSFQSVSQSMEANGKGSQKKDGRCSKERKSMNHSQVELMSTLWVTHVQLCSMTHRNAMWGHYTAVAKTACVPYLTHIPTHTFLCMVCVYESSCTLCKWVECVRVSIGTWLSILSSCSVALFCSDSIRARIPVPVMKLDSTFRLFSVVFTFNISASAWEEMHSTSRILINSLLCSLHSFALLFQWTVAKMKSLCETALCLCLIR